MGKVAKATVGWIFYWLAVAGCSSVDGQRRIVPAPSAKALSEALITSCPESHPEGTHVVPCDTVQLEAVDLGILGLGRALAHLRAENTALRQTGALDLETEKGRTAELQRRLDNPWRSPWLWGSVCLAVGFASGLAIAAGAR